MNSPTKIWDKEMEKEELEEEEDEEEEEEEDLRIPVSSDKEINLFSTRIRYLQRKKSQTSVDCGDHKVLINQTDDICFGTVPRVLEFSQDFEVAPWDYLTSADDTISSLANRLRIGISSQVLEDDQDDKTNEQPNTNIEYDDSNNYHESVEQKKTETAKDELFSQSVNEQMEEHDTEEEKEEDEDEKEVKEKEKKEKNVEKEEKEEVEEILVNFTDEKANDKEEKEEIKTQSAQLDPSRNSMNSPTKIWDKEMEKEELEEEEDEEEEEEEDLRIPVSSDKEINLFSTRVQEDDPIDPVLFEDNNRTQGNQEFRSSLLQDQDSTEKDHFSGLKQSSGDSEDLDDLNMTREHDLLKTEEDKNNLPKPTNEKKFYAPDSSSDEELEEEYAKRSVDLDASESEEEEDDNYKIQPQNNAKAVTLAPTSTREISEEMASKSVQSIGGIEDDAQVKPPTGSEAEKPNSDSNKKPEAEDFSDLDLKDPQLELAATKIQSVFKGFQARKKNNLRI
ncbi:myb-like protein X [Eurytemora carolleeae]|uniref:myb-like protein X n=1 Tax=Eurytemora carolleeae TaxID=1294199 RepID=UPI000C780DD9|nr:myb-like protein X [Eurytemora carolleeae]|eukprot:XP_023344940.1 myb-like protein X [Eurytemora affinis]